MAITKLGIIHPGAMGVSVGASARRGGCAVFWASAGRSERTRQRAFENGFTDLETLQALCGTAEILISICPPHAAEDIAEQVARYGFAGLFVDANAISPQRARRIGDLVTKTGARFVDGGIVGGPAWEPGATTLYLSGAKAARVSACFEAGPLETSILGPETGAASALKMCYAAWTKGQTALLCAVVAAAYHLEVWEPLSQQWERDWPGFPGESSARVQRVTAKAWRFAGEMEEIASTFTAAGLPGGFHQSAADLYRRIARYKDSPSLPDLQDVLAALLRPTSQNS